MSCVAKTVLFCNLVGPGLDAAGIDLDGEPALTTDQVVVVVRGATGAIEQLAIR